jgi:TRAP-type C4-dicarboxylate transport system substrate-binding protein
MGRLKNIFISLMILISLTNLFSQDKSTPKYLFKIATDAPDNSNWIMTFKFIDADLRKQTNGEVGLTVYPASLMGDQNTVVKKIKIGQLSGSALSSGGLELIYKDFAIMGFPMIFNTVEEFDYVSEKMMPYYEAESEKRDFVFISWTEVGFIYLFSKKKVNSIETLKSAKPFILEGDDVSKALFDEFKTNAVQTQMSDILTGLQTNYIDTVFSSTYGLIVTQWFTKVNYMADFPITFMLGGIVIDKKLFMSMPKNYQDIMRKSFKDNFSKLSAKLRKDNDNARKSIEKNGIKFIPIDKKDQDKFQEACNKTRINLTAKSYSRDVLEKILKYVEEYRSSHK